MFDDQYEKYLEFICLVETTIDNFRKQGVSTNDIFKQVIYDFEDKQPIKSYNSMCDLYDNYRINGIINDKLATELVVSNYVLNQYLKGGNNRQRRLT